MKLVYTHENRLLVANAQNLLTETGIATTLKNEYASGATGELSFLSTWPELWVLNDSDFECALELIKKTSNNDNEAEWLCTQCGEQNSESFDSCWNCQFERA